LHPQNGPNGVFGLETASCRAKGKESKQTEKVFTKNRTKKGVQKSYYKLCKYSNPA
jgi:hypothetical protein